MKFSDFDTQPFSDVLKHYSAAKLAATLIRDVQARSASTRWATDSMASLHPFAMERDKPRWLKPGQEPKSQMPHYNHWLTEAGEILGWTMRGMYPTIIVRTNSNDGTTIVDHVTYNRLDDPNVEWITRGVFKDGRIQSERRIESSRGVETRYVWIGDRLSQSFKCYWKNNDDTIRLERFDREDYRYNSFGELETITSTLLNEDGTEVPGRNPEIQFQKRQKGITISELNKKIEARLTELIPNYLAKVEGDFYCLLLCYCSEDAQGAWPPFLVLGAVSELHRITREGRDVPYFLWAADELRNRPANIEIQIADESIQAMCKAHLELMDQSGDYKSVPKTLQAVAKALQTIDLPPSIRKHDDFVIAAVDNTAIVPPVKDIKACIAKETFQVLKKRGWVK